MPSIEKTIAASCSLVLRIASHAFLRWLPGSFFLRLLGSVTAIYCLAFFKCLKSTSPYTSTKIDIKVVAKPVHLDDPDAIKAKLSAASLHTSVLKNEPLQELEAEETVVEMKEPRIFYTLITGLPSPGSITWSAVTFLINISLFLMVLDHIYRGTVFYPAHDLSFARVGYVSADTANILLREPDQNLYPLRLFYRLADTVTPSSLVHDQDEAAWNLAASVDSSGESTDFISQFFISELATDTRYEWKSSNSHGGFFVTAPLVGAVSRRPEAEGKFTFVHSSCLLPNFPYSVLAHPLSVLGFRHLSKWLGIIRPAFMLFLGDFIYADVPKSHGIDTESYRRKYRHVYASPDWPLVTSTRYSIAENDREYDIPWIHVYDDHEIANDWDRNTTGIYRAAFDAYDHYHLSVNPPFLRSDALKEVITYSTFNHGPASFFMLDTRRYRTPSNISDPQDTRATILGHTQLSDLISWLSAPSPQGVHWKIVVSSVPFTKNWRVNAADTWSGYLHERRVILEAMWDFAARETSTSVVIISGDRHEFAATSFPPPQIDESQRDQNVGKWPLSATVHEFSVSPLSMFYLPFHTYRQTDEEDICIRYIPQGNYKFGAVDILPESAGKKSELHYRLFADGEERWAHVLIAGGAVTEELLSRN